MSYTPHTNKDIEEMLGFIGKKSLDELFETVPGEIFRTHDPDIPESKNEMELKNFFRKISEKIDVFNISFLGAGCYRHYIPSGVKAITSDGRFYTAYTPYQPEASQGTLQAIYEYQTYIAMLTGMDVANASLYDGASAVCEAAVMAMAETKRNKIIVSETLHKEYAETLETYLGKENIVVLSMENGVSSRKKLSEHLDSDTAGVIIQTPNFFGCIENLAEFKEEVKKNKSLLIAAINEPYSLGVLKNPGECGADIAAGDAQAFGSPTAFGGPSLGFIAVRKNLMRKIPGRLCGKTKDINGKDGFVLTLQAREQHIRRDKASSNICSNEALCALAATVHLSLLGKEGFLAISRRNVSQAHYASKVISEIPGFSLKFNAPFFNEFTIKCEADPELIVNRLASERIGAGIPIGRFFPELSDCLLIAVTETTEKEEIDVFAKRLAEISKELIDK